jgi:hypothetical protein
MRPHGGRYEASWRAHTRTHDMSRRARAGCQVRKRDLNPSLSQSLSPPLCFPALPPPPPAAGVGEEQRGPESYSVPPVTFAPPPPQSRASGETKVQERNGLRVQWETRLGIHVVVRVCRVHVAQPKRKYRRTIVRRPPNWMNSTQLCCPIWKISEISDVASRSLKQGSSRD